MTLDISEKQFYDFLASQGHPLDSPLNHDSTQFHYYKCPHGASSDARYKFHSDGIPSGYFKCWKCQIEADFCSKQKQEVSPEEWQTHIERMVECRRQNEIETQQRHAVAAKEAKKIWAAAIEVTKENITALPYLQSKNVSSFGLRYLTKDITYEVYPKKYDLNGKEIIYKVYQGTLLVPAYNADNELVNLERIYFSKKENKFQKRPLRGGQRDGAYYLIGEVTVSQAVIYISEGYATGATVHEATGCPVAIAFSCGNLHHIIKILRQKYPHSRLVIIADNDEAGLKAAKKACTNVKNAAYILPNFSVLGLSDEKLAELNPTDINDLFVHLMAKGLSRTAALDIVRQQIQQHSIQGNCMTEDNLTQKELLIIEIKRLASLEDTEYELTREEIANKFNIRVGKLDEFVNKERKTEAQKSDNILFPRITPWRDFVELEKLLDEIDKALNQFVVFQTEHEARAITLWILHTHVFDAFDLTPFLFISSPEKRCGKSTLLDLIQELVLNPLVATNITPAAFFRSVELYKPTLLIEEVDAFMRENEELRGIVNGSNSRKLSFVLRCIGDPPEPKQFNTYCPKAFCGIGKLPETIEDRAVIIRLNRKTSKEEKEKRRLRNKSQQQTFSDLRSKCVRFAQDNIDKLKTIDYEKEVEPFVPKSLDSRATDNWEPLIAIAKLAGNKWIEYAKSAALHLSGIKEEVLSFGVELLSDIRDVFDDLRSDRIFSRELLERLNKIDEAPWPTFHHGKPMTARQLGNRLRDYKIKSKDIRIAAEKAKGFERNQFEDAWKRYIPGIEYYTQDSLNFTETSETPRQCRNNGGSNVSSLDTVSDKEQKQYFNKGTCLDNVSVIQARQPLNASDKKSPQANNNGICLGVSDKKHILEGVNDYVDI